MMDMLRLMIFDFYHSNLVSAGWKCLLPVPIILQAKWLLEMSMNLWQDHYEYLLNCKKTLNSDLYQQQYLPFSVFLTKTKFITLFFIHIITYLFPSFLHYFIPLFSIHFHYSNLLFYLFIILIIIIIWVF